MQRSARSLKVKEKQFMRLYSRWHETHDEDIQKRWLALLSQILRANPRFSIRREFQIAF